MILSEGEREVISDLVIDNFSDVQIIDLNEMFYQNKCGEHQLSIQTEKTE